MIIKTDAVILRRVAWSNTSWVLWTYTRSAGAVRTLAKGARRMNNKKPEKPPDLFAMGQMVAYVSAHRELANLAAWDEMDDFRGIRRSPGRLFAAGHIARSVVALADAGDPHPALFELLEISLRQLAGEASPELVLCAFLLKALAELGHAPVVDRNAETGEALTGRETNLRFNAIEGGLVIREQARDTDIPIGPEAVAVARFLAGGGPVEGLQAHERAKGQLERCLHAAVEAASGRTVQEFTKVS
jgi:DNA repair protein RecO (recombination protein O)